MATVGAFKFEDDPLKHFVRVNGWLPLCAARLQLLQARKPKLQRRLRYFTFCAVNAVDVLMLDVAKIVRPSTNGRFNTVFFFDRSADLVAQTLQRVPGAIGFAGNFVETVLALDPVGDPLVTPEAEQDTAVVRERQRRQTTKRDFLEKFPFDVLNLDLEDIIFQANDVFPGQVLNALRRVFEWQRRPLQADKRSEEYLDGFTLLFTTRVGPPQLRDDYATMLTTELVRNIQRDDTLQPLLEARTGAVNAADLHTINLTSFFELGIPKILASILMEEDWHISPEPGVSVYRFTRPAELPNPSYDMLHFAMNVSRHNPPRERRAPQTIPAAVTTAYEHIARDIFQKPATVVDEALATATALIPSLDEIKSRRRKYYPDSLA